VGCRTINPPQGMSGLKTHFPADCWSVWRLTVIHRNINRCWCLFVSHRSCVARFCSLPFVVCTMRASYKGRRKLLLSCLHLMLSDFNENTFNGTFSRQFTIKRSLKIPSHLNYVATLPCELLVDLLIIHTARRQQLQIKQSEERGQCVWLFTLMIVATAIITLL